MHTSNPTLKRRLYLAGLIGALFMSIVMLMATFTSIVPNLPAQIAMTVAALIVGFFGVSGLLSGTRLGLVVCVVFSIVEVFSHTSLGLVSTHLESQVAKSALTATDAEYDRLTARAKTLDDTARALAEKVATTTEGYRSEVDVRQKGVEKANQDAKDASDAVTAYVNAKGKGTNKAPERDVMIDADNFFTAIPDALTSNSSGRIIAFWFYFLIFTGIVLTALMTAKGLADMGTETPVKIDEVKEETEELDLASTTRPGRTPGVRRDIPKKTVYAWVNETWRDHTEGQSDKPVSRPRVKTALEGLGVKITDLWDQKLFEALTRLGLVTIDGKVTVPVIEARKRLDADMTKGGA